VVVVPRTQEPTIGQDGILQQVYGIYQQILGVESRIKNLGPDMQQIAQDQYKRTFKPLRQPESLFGLSRALCIDTVDPWQENRVRFFTPILHAPNMPILALPWARPISPMGGFDDCGLNWVPPAGTILCLLF
jgi:hypothetical protein